MKIKVLQLIIIINNKKIVYMHEMCYNGWLGIAVVLSWVNTFFYLICFLFILFLFVVVYVNLFIFITRFYAAYLVYVDRQTNQDLD